MKCYGEQYGQKILKKADNQCGPDWRKVQDRINVQYDIGSRQECNLQQNLETETSPLPFLGFSQHYYNISALFKYQYSTFSKFSHKLLYSSPVKRTVLGTVFNVLSCAHLSPQNHSF